MMSGRPFRLTCSGGTLFHAWRLSRFTMLISIALLTCALPTTSTKSDKLPPGTAAGWADPGALRAFVGNYPFDQVNRLKLVEVPEVRSRIQMLLGANVPNLINQWVVSPPSVEHAGWLVAAGCKPHECRDNEWVIAINLSDYNVFICFAEEDKPVKYGAQEK